MTAKSVASLSLKGRALRWLAAREHTRAELRTRLLEHETDERAVDALLDELTARDYLSDHRAAEALAHRRAPRYGSDRVAHELDRRGVEAPLAADLVGRLQQTDLERAREVWRKKFGSPATDEREYARQARFMASRGFPAETVRRLLREPSGDD